MNTTKELSISVTGKPSRQSLTDYLKKILKEIVQPFIDLAHAPRALWGVNLGYMLEGLSYFGMLTYLAIFFSDFVFKGVAHADTLSHYMVMMLTAGIAIAMVFFGFIPDKIGVRRALIFSFVLLLAGRAVMSSASTIFGLTPDGLWSPLHYTVMAGIFLVVIGSGVYQPAAYSAVRHFTTPKTASMAYAMLYALMNAGSSLTMMGFLLRDDKFLGLGIPGTFWAYTAVTLCSLLVTLLILSGKTVNRTIASVKAEGAASKATSGPAAESKTQGNTNALTGDIKVPWTAWIVLLGILAAVAFRIPNPWNYVGAACILLFPAIIAALPRDRRVPVLRWIAEHPLADPRFFFLIFILIPVQTLFTYNWLVLPQYISRAFSGGWIGEYYEIASNINPVLIFIFVPVITALTIKQNIYKMLIVGTLIMGFSAFVLAIGPSIWTLGAYLVLMTIGESIWSARFLQYATEIAPEGKAGHYQGVAQLPWFLTKFLVPLLYSGRMIEHYCPAQGLHNTSAMWFLFGLIAIVTPIGLIVAKKWMMKGIGNTK